MTYFYHKNKIKARLFAFILNICIFKGRPESHEGRCLTPYYNI